MTQKQEANGYGLKLRPLPSVFTQLVVAYLPMPIYSSVASAFLALVTDHVSALKGQRF